LDERAEGLLLDTLIELSESKSIFANDQLLWKERSDFELVFITCVNEYKMVSIHLGLQGDNK